MTICLNARLLQTVKVSLLLIKKETRLFHVSAELNAKVNARLFVMFMNILELTPC